MKISAKTASGLGVLIIEITLGRCENFSSKMQILKINFRMAILLCEKMIHHSQNTKYKQLRKNIYSKEPEQFMAINADYASVIKKYYRVPKHNNISHLGVI